MDSRPQTRDGALAWAVAQDPGVWLYDWLEDRNEKGELIRKRQVRSLNLSEALIRVTDEHGAALVDCLRDIEQGAVLGVMKGWEGD